MYQHEADALKRDLERLQLEHTLLRRDLERGLTGATHAADPEIARLSEENARLAQRVNNLEAGLAALNDPGRPVTELLVLASTRAAALLALIASRDDEATVRTLEAATSTLRSRTIYTNNDPYLTRWYVWPEGPRTVEDSDLERHDGDPDSDLPFALFLHKFHRGDADRDQHNHPWNLSVAIVLAGGYREERGSETKVVMPGMINVIRGDEFHRVDLLDPKAGSWSLFIAGRRTGGWGFKNATTGAFIPNKEYLAARAVRNT